jgi:hypothetical protein
MTCFFPLLRLSITPIIFIKGGQNEKSQSVYFCFNVLVGPSRFISTGHRSIAAADR